jgi:hypothetical protein
MTLEPRPIARLNASDVARLLAVSERRVREIPAAELPYVALTEHGRRRYVESDVLAYLERRTVRT